MKIQLGIGAGTQTVEVPDRCVQQVLEPNPVPHGLTGEAEVRRALAEARLVAGRIRQLLDEGYPVQDGGTLRPCRPEDIVVLMRSPTSRALDFAQALEEQL